jgi:hypothetical protein
VDLQLVLAVALRQVSRSQVVVVIAASSVLHASVAVLQVLVAVL